MNIQRVDLIYINMPLVLPFETSYECQSDIVKLLLKVFTPDAVVYSECIADENPFYWYETIGTVSEVLKKFFLPSIMGVDLQGPEHYWQIISRFQGHPMAKAALENAIWILKALEEGQSLATMLGGVKETIVSGVSIGIQHTIGELLDLINTYLDQRYPRIKMKIKPGKDVEVIAEVREHYPHITLMVDANNAFTLSQLDTLKAMDHYHLLMIEQPLAYDDLIDHAKLQAKMNTPLCLDESIHSPYFARVAAELNACRIINIKQGKVGGLSPAREVHDICQAHHIGVWCGGMLETGVGRAVNVALATLPNFVYPNDISASERYWQEDIIDQPFTINPDGTITVPTTAGLGVSVNENALERYTIERKVIRI